MYNLLISGDTESWLGKPWIIELSRCVREYTDDDITKRFGELRPEDVAELKRLPCIFAYEAQTKLHPKFGILRDVVRRKDHVRIEYEIQPLSPFLSIDEVATLTFELDIVKWELNRTHWAVKDVDLAKELRAQGITLPSWVRNSKKTVDVATHEFDVALSFPGEVRPIVEKVAEELERLIGPNSYFYDNNYTAQLARPSLDTLLQDIYGKRSKLIVVFVGSDYQRKDWCGIEFRAIKEIIMGRDHKRIMFIRMDDKPVDGVFNTDGFIDGHKFSPAELAHFIHERVGLLSA